MKSKKVQFKILWVTAFVYLFTLSDVFFSPAKVDIEICTRLFTRRRPLAKYQQTYYYLHTNKHTYSVSEQVYRSVSIGQRIFIIRSAVTGANRYVEVINNGQIISCDIRFMSESGLVVLIFFTSITVLFMIFYDTIRYAPGRMNLTIFLAIIAMILFIFHLRGALEL